MGDGRSACERARQTRWFRPKIPKFTRDVVAPGPGRSFAGQARQDQVGYGRAGCRFCLVGELVSHGGCQWSSRWFRWVGALVQGRRRRGLWRCAPCAVHFMGPCEAIRTGQTQQFQNIRVLLRSLRWGCAQCAVAPLRRFCPRQFRSLLARRRDRGI
jgi:hypothetical protein